MELIAQVLLVLLALSSLFQMSQWPIGARIILSFLLTIFAFYSYPWVIEQSKEQLNLWLEDPNKMQNLAVVLLIEAFLFIFLDLALLKKCFGQSVNSYVKYASFYPGIFLLAVVLYAQMLCFYSFSDIDFDTLGIIFALGLSIFLFLGPMAIKWLIPEDFLRMELRYILNFGLILGGIVITVFCQGLTYPSSQDSIEWIGLIIVIALSISMMGLGWLGAKMGKRMKFLWKF